MIAILNSGCQLQTAYMAINGRKFYLVLANSSYNSSILLPVTVMEHFMATGSIVCISIEGCHYLH